MRMRLNVLGGLTYGVALTLGAITAAAAGHGTYAPIRVSSAPFGIFGGIAALAGMPILWTVIGLGCDWLVDRAGRNAIRIALFAHYGSALWLVLSDAEDVRYLVRGPLGLWLVFMIWAHIYGGGQVIVWRTLRDVSH